MPARGLTGFSCIQGLAHSSGHGVDRDCLDVRVAGRRVACGAEDDGAVGVHVQYQLAAARGRRDPPSERLRPVARRKRAHVVVVAGDQGVFE